MQNRGLLITLIVLLSLVVILLSAGFVFLMMGKVRLPFSFFSGNYNLSEHLVEDIYYEEEFATIEINAEASEVEVKQANDDRIHVLIYGEKENIKIEKKESTLQIEDRNKRKFCIGICNREISKIELYLPATFSSTLQVNNKFGDIKIDHFIESTMMIKDDCGDIEIIGAKNVEVLNHYGDIKVGEAESAKVEADCGDIEITSTKSADVKNHMGDIEIREINGYAAINNDCGDIEIETLSLDKNSRIANNLGNIKIGATNEIYIDAKTSLGDTSIRNNSRTAEITLTIDNSCGDIEVNN